MRTNIFPLILGFLLIIFNAENVKATITLGTNAGFVNTNGAVAPPGALPFQIDVNQIGAATGNLPFEFPAGFGDLVPSLGLTYSQYADLGNFGMGCYLSGISCITRAGQSVYYDNKVTAVDFTTNDRFMLDGQRLLLATGTYGAAGATYKTESESFTTITSVGTTNSAPDKFTLVTKDGATLVYGESDAKVTVVNTGLSTVTLCWPLKKMTDARGNYIEYLYTNTTDGQIKLTNIKYTANTGVSFQFNISLTYQEFSNPEYYYLGGRQLKNSLYITEVKVTDLTANTELTKYTFGYTDNKITSINKYYKGLLACKPTTLIWNNPSKLSTIKQIAQLDNSGLYNVTSSNESITGDFDGDGINDVFQISRGTDRVWKLMNVNNSSLTVKATGTLPVRTLRKTSENVIVDYKKKWNWRHMKLNFEPVFKSVTTNTIPLPNNFADIDGDGSLELCTIEGNKDVDPDNYNFRAYDVSASGLTLLSAFSKDNIGDVADNNILLVGNFTGRGIQEVALLKANSPIFNNTGVISFPSVTNARNIAMCEFNNSPATELMIMDNTSVKVYTAVYSTSLEQYVMTQVAAITGINTSNAQTGDFNGDGLVDVMLYNTAGAKWQLYYSNGKDGFLLQPDNILSSVNLSRVTNNNSSSGVHVSISASPEARYFNCPADKAKDDQNIHENSWDNQYAFSNKYFVYDIDGDGYSEIVRIERDCWFEANQPTGSYIMDSKYRVHIFDLNDDDEYSYEGPLFTADNVYPPVCSTTNSASLIGSVELKFTVLDDYTQLSLLDYNSDGYPELVYQSDQMIYNPDGTLNTAKATVLQFYQGNPSQFLSSVINGMGLTANLAYDRLKTGTFYTNDPTTGLPSTVHEGLFPLYVVTNKTISNTIQSFSDIDYSYSSLRYQELKGLLGFKSITSNDAVTKQKTIQLFDVNATYFVPYLKQVTNYYNTALIGKTEYAFTFSGQTTAKVFYQFANQVKETNSLTGVVVTKDFEMYYTGSDLKTLTETYGSDGTIKTTYSNYIAGKPKNVSVTRTQNGTFTSTRAFTYDSYGNVLTETDNYGIVTTYTYNTTDHTRVETIVNSALNTSTKLTYDATKRFIAKKEITYNNVTGKPILTESATYDNEGRQLTQTDINDLVTTFTYDAYGQLAGKTLPDGRNVALAYGWQTSATQPLVTHYTQTTSDLGDVATTYFDALGRQQTKKSTPVGGSLAQVENTFATTGQLSTAVSNIDGTTTYTYRTDGRLSSVTGLGQTFSYSYSGKATIQTLNGVTKTTTNNAFGQVASVVDAGGTISYTYHPSGQVLNITANGETTTMDYDAKGRQTELNDPDAGLITYEYNSIGQLIKQTDANNTVTDMVYDGFGRQYQRTETMTGTTRTVTTLYYTTKPYIGLVQSETDSESGVVVSYTYDNYGKMLTRTETIDGADYTFTYAYDAYGRVTYITYPDGLQVKQTWTGNYLKSIVDVTTNVNLLSSINYNSRNQVSTYAQGNGNSVSNTYDTYGYAATQTFGPTVARLKYTYTFDATTQNLTARSLTNLATSAVQTENFSYDKLDRLTAWSVTNSNGTTTRTAGYQSNGNFTQKDEMGFYIYNDAKPHAVTAIAELSGTAVTARDCEVTYNSFNKTKMLTLKSGTTTLKTAAFTYGPDNQRRTMTTTTTSAVKTLYTGLYQVNGGTQRLHYIAGPEGLAALIVTYSNNSTRTVYYLQTDYQGSLVAVYNSNGTLNKQFSYDPWGRRRNPANWGDYTVSTETLFTRGYTGHEHLDDFGLINMNGRVYDPRLARFLSPDNYVQAPTNTQSYNRYSYCLNNPMKYTDPSGNFFNFQNWWRNLWADPDEGERRQPTWDHVAQQFGARDAKQVVIASDVTEGILIASTICGFYAGTYVTGLLGLESGFTYGLVFGFTSGYVRGQMSGSLLAWILGKEDFYDGLKIGARNGLKEGMNDAMTYSTGNSGGNLKLWQMILLNNMKDNMDVFEGDEVQIHAGPVGYDFDGNHIYTIFSKDITTGQRIDMGMESVYCLSLIKNGEYGIKISDTRYKDRQQWLGGRNELHEPVWLTFHYKYNYYFNTTKNFLYPYWFYFQWQLQ